MKCINKFIIKLDKKKIGQEKRKNMKKIAIYGTGRVAEYFMNNYDFKGEKLSLFIETKKVEKNSWVILLLI